MKLISCEIRAFGHLIDHKHDFTDSLNPILQDNGWGKTTFCVFIKSMFYGLEYNQKHSLNERKHYKPWDGGDYGGSLTFESDGKRYRIERSFGDKDKDDTFCLYNADTGLESDDFGENLGEEIFGVDRESFVRSIFIPQETLETSMTDSLNAKMGNLSTVQDDINRFDEAIGRVTEKLKDYTGRGSRNPGSIVKLKERIRQQNELLEKLPSLRSAYDSASELLTQKKTEHHQLTFLKNELTESIAKQSKREQETGAYLEKKQAIKKLRDEESDLSDFFSRGIPEADEIAAIEEKDRERTLSAERKHEFLTRLPRESEVERLRALFEGHEVDDETLEAWRRDADEIRKLKEYCAIHRMQPQSEETLKELKVYFAQKEPVESEINQASDDALKLVQIDGQIETLEEKHQKAQAAEKESIMARHLIAPASWVASVVALVLLAGGFMHYWYYGFSRGPWFMAVCVGVGTLILLLIILMALKNRRDIRLEKRRLAEELRQAAEELEVKRYQRKETLERIMGFLKGYLVTPTDNFAQMVSEIKGKSDMYRSLLAAEVEYLNETKESTERLSDLSVQFHTSLAYFVDAYGNYHMEDIDETEVLERLGTDVDSYRQIKSNLTLIDAEEARQKEIEAQITSFLSRFPLSEEEKAGSFVDIMGIIRKRADRYAIISESIEEMEKDIAAFEADNDMAGEPESVEQMQLRQQEIDERITELSQLIVKEQDRLANLSDEIETLEEVEESIADLEDKKQELIREADIIERTGKYLKQARERFLSKYMGPLRNGLRKYLGLIVDDESVDDFELDMNLDVRYVRKGATWNAQYLSTGYQDLVSLCARMALIDVLYTRERPPIVLDDPFTNLDDEKLKNALALVERLASDRQIIYLTCHQSRMMNTK